MSSKRLKQLPIYVKVEDKIDLIHKLLSCYAAINGALTKTNISILSFALVYDMNSPDFFTILQKAKVVKSKEHYRVEIGRLKQKEMFSQNEKKEKILSKALQQIQMLSTADLKEFNIDLIFSFSGGE